MLGSIQHCDVIEEAPERKDVLLAISIQNINKSRNNIASFVLQFQGLII